MHLDAWTLGLQTINLVLLVWLLQRFLFRPLAAMVRERQVHTERLLAEAEAARQTAADENANLQAARVRLADERRQALATAEAEANARRTALIAAATADADRIRSSATADGARQQHEQTLVRQREARQLAVEITRRLLARLPAVTDPLAFLPGLCEAVAKLPAAARTRLSDVPLVLRAHQALPTDAIETCAAALAAVLHHPVTLTVTIEPALVAGLELEGPDTCVRNHLAADLDHVAAALADHDHA